MSDFRIYIFSLASFRRYNLVKYNKLEDAERKCRVAFELNDRLTDQLVIVEYTAKYHCKIVKIIENDK